MVPGEGYRRLSLAIVRLASCGRAMVGDDVLYGVLAASSGLRESTVK